MPTVVAPTTGTQVSSALTAAITAARAQLGQRYVWGGESRAEGGFDCSGLVQYAFGQAGVKLPRTAADQQRATTRVSTPMPGDLVFYGSPADHVGIYLGGGMMIAAPKPGDVVKIQKVYGQPTNYGRVTGSVSTGATGKDAANPWLAVAGGAAGSILGPGGLASGIQLGLGGGLDSVVPGMDSLGQVAAGTVSVASAVNRAGAWLSVGHNWVRVGQVIVGGVLVVTGVGMVVKPAVVGAVSPVAGLVK